MLSLCYSGDRYGPWIFCFTDMGKVNICPKNQTEVDEAGEKLGCGQDKYGHSQYMCIPNEEKTALVEFCYDGVMGIEFKGEFFL